MDLLLFIILVNFIHDTYLFYFIFISWNATSNDALAKATPVKPPIVNKNKNAIAYNIGSANLIEPP